MGEQVAQILTNVFYQMIVHLLHYVPIQLALISARVLLAIRAVGLVQMVVQI